MSRELVPVLKKGEVFILCPWPRGSKGEKHKFKKIRKTRAKWRN